MAFGFLWYILSSMPIGSETRARGRLSMSSFSSVVVQRFVLHITLSGI